METELTRLLRQIDEEYDAAYAGMNAFASGAARHRFITAKLEHIGKCKEELTKLVGEEESLKLLLSIIDKERGGT